MTFLTFLFILIQVESGGNNYAVGAHGELGALQISEAVIQDVNRIYGVYYIHADAYNREASIEIATKYLNYYASKERLGREPTWEDLARIWNGGPNGYQKNSTIKYWQKVEPLLHSF